MGLAVYPYWLLWYTDLWFAREFLDLKIYWWDREWWADKAFRVLQQVTDIIYEIVICDSQKDFCSWKFYLWLRVLWIFKAFLDLNVFPHSWHGKESPSRCVSMCFSNLCLAVVGWWLPTASFPQILHFDFPLLSVSMYCCTVFRTSLTSVDEIGTTGSSRLNGKL